VNVRKNYTIYLLQKLLYEVDDNMKKSKIIKIISSIILVLGLVLIVFGIYRYFDYKKTIDNYKIIEISLDLTSSEVINLYNNVNQNNNNCVDFFYEFENLEILSKNISPSFALDMFLFNYKKNNELNESSIDYTKVKESLKSLYGEEYKFNIEDINGSTYLDFYYKKNNLIYIKDPNCNNRTIKTKLYEAIEIDNTIELYEYRLYEEDNTYYNSPNSEEKLDVTLDESNKIIDNIENYSKGLNYKYIFKLKDNHYYLEKIQWLL
ncbi:MAG: hypothetical protein ACI4OT_02775, partial [Bacilli bacterium]